MIGPQFRIALRSTRAVIGIFDVLVLGVFGWLAVSAGGRDIPPDAPRALAAAAVTALFLLTGLGLERARLHLARTPDWASPALVSLFGGVVVTRTESLDERRAGAVGRSGFLLDALALAVFAGVAAGLYDTSSEWQQAAFALFGLLTGMAALRLCTVQGLNGGRVIRWYFASIFDDEDGVEQAAKTLSMAISVLVMLSGFFMLAQPSDWNVWGLALLAAGVDCAALTQWHSRRERWVRAASGKRVGEIGHSKLPTIKQSAPVSELLSIFAIEGQRALIVVTDDRGQPAGLIQLRQLKAAVHSGRPSHPDEMMVTLSHVPHVDRDTTILDAALFLERTGQLAMVFEGASGKLRVVSLDELRAIID